MTRWTRRGGHRPCGQVGPRPPPSAVMGKEDLLAVLQGVNVDHVDKQVGRKTGKHVWGLQGQAALHMAVSAALAASVDTLLDMGADVGLPTGWENSRVGPVQGGPDASPAGGQPRPGAGHQLPAQVDQGTTGHPTLENNFPLVRPCVRPSPFLLCVPPFARLSVRHIFDPAAYVCLSVCHVFDPCQKKACIAC